MKLFSSSANRFTFIAVGAWALLLLSLVGCSQSEAGNHEADYVPTVLLTGTHKEIGFDFAKKYAEQGWNVIATDPEPDNNSALQELVQKHSNITVETLDVADFDAIDDLALKYRDQPIDLLLSSTRISVAEATGGMDVQKFGQFNYDVFNEMARINALAPLKLIETFHDNVAKSRQKKFVTISSSNGVIGSLVKTKCRRCGNFFGKASYATTSMLIHRVDMHLRGRDSEIVVGLLNPGPVDIAAVKPLVADNFPSDSLIPVGESVDAMMDIIANYYTLETSGQFIDYRGHELPW